MSEIIKNIEEYLENKKEQYEEIVVKNGFIGDSITYELYYEDAKEIISFIKQLQRQNFKLQARADRYKHKLDICKSVLDEVREEMDNNLSYDENIDDCWTTTNKLYKILGRVKESDNE